MFDIVQRNAMIDSMRKELTDVGVKELRTPEEVQQELGSATGTTLVFVNSVCGCAAGAARPGLRLSLTGDKKPDRVVTVFAGQDRDATEKARSYFVGLPPSSPSAVLMKNGQVVEMVHRHQIEGRSAEMVAKHLSSLYEKHC